MGRMQNDIIPNIKVQSVNEYTKGTLLHDSITEETFEVLSCIRIRLDRELPEYGLLLKEIR